MFRIVDGRDSFYQWDLDRQIAVEDNSIVEVHFCNRTDDCSLVVEVVDGIANVPNIILTNSFDVRVFGYDGKATLHDKVFKVKPRTRPADYVYTETEVKNFETLEKQINERLDKIEEEGVTVDLTGYATEEYVDEATEPNKCFYIDIDKCEIGKLYDLTDEMIALIEYFEKYRRAHVFIKYNQTNTVGSSGYVPAKIYRFAAGEFDITPSELDSYALCSEQTQRTISISIVNSKYKLTYLHGKTEAIIATTDYVDKAIANIEISGGETDLSDYYTKAETDGKIEEAVEAIDIPEVDLEDYYTKEEVDDYIATVIYRMVKPSGTEPTEDPMDEESRLQITDAHTIEYLNRVFAGEAVLGYTWRIGLKSYLITDFTKAGTRLTLRAHRLMGATITHYTFYMDIEDDGNWYWVGHHTEDYNIQKATEDAIQTAFDDVVTAEGGAY